MFLLKLALLVLYTVALGVPAILLCLIVPGGSAVPPLARLWSRLVLLTAGVRTSASYHPRFDPARPAVYVANHQSQMDIPALALGLPADFRMVAKRELLHIPIFGWALWLAGFVFIERSDRDDAIRRLDRAAARVRRGVSIVVFAEGTRSADGTLLPFKKGGFILALKAGVPIVPVAIRGGAAVLPPGALRPKPGRIDVHFGEPVDTSAYSFETRDALIAAVRDRIAAALARPEAAAPAGPLSRPGAA